MKAGSYRFQVKASGPWRLLVEQPSSSADTNPLPVSQTMTGDAPLGPFALKAGLLVAEFTHEGDSNFAAVLYRSNGENAGLLVNKIGQYKGTVAERISSTGSYWVAVRANGGWSIKLSQ